MKKNRKNIFYTLIKSSLFRGFYFSIFMFHLIFAHSFFANYILCVEENGQVNFESILEQQICCSSSIDTEISLTNKFEKGVDSCKDISISNECDEEKSIVSQKPIQKIFVNSIIVCNNFELMKRNINPLFLVTSNISLSSQLSAYKTISLII